MHERVSAGCLGKQVHRTWALALDVCSAMRKRHHESFEPYICKTCGRIHIGTALTPPKNRKRSR